MRLLIVKTSSMGDVVHALPALTDLLQHRPGTEVDWLVEAPFAAIVAMHPGVRQVLPMAWRKWRKALGRRETWQAMGQLRAQLRANRYDLVLDLQGLLKSMVWARQAGVPVAGPDAASAREPLASLGYARRATSAKGQHAVRRNRELAAAHLGYALPASVPDFGLRPAEPTWLPAGELAALIPNASRPEKFWPQAHWVAVGQRLRAQGWTPVVLWGSAQEQRMAEEIAQGCGGVVPPFLKVGDVAGVLARCELVVGLDTGFSHLAAALGRPTVGIYCDHEPAHAGITGAGGVDSIGGKGQRPSLQDVMALVEGRIAALR